jgi:phosphatidylinositol alpha-1,6-mannosyltransferase
MKALADRLGDVVVYTASMSDDDGALDSALPYRVIRDRSSTLLPTRRTRDAVVRAFREQGCDRVLIGSSVPLGFLAPALREAGAKRIVAITHGHEVTWASLPLGRALLRRVVDSVDVITDIADFTRDRITRALTPEERTKQARLAPGVNTDRFRPGAGGATARSVLGIDASTPLVVCSGRLLPRKGQDVLIDAGPQVAEAVPGAHLALVGEGRSRRALEQRAVRRGVADSVTFVGAVPWEEVPCWTDAADVSVGPSRNQFFGLSQEGLGIVFLEAAACGKPVIVGRSGGAPETVVDGETGFVVDPRGRAAIAARIIDLLRHPEMAAAMGAKGRQWAVDNWQWDFVGERCRELLGLTDRESATSAVVQ